MSAIWRSGICCGELLWWGADSNRRSHATTSSIRNSDEGGEHTMTYNEEYENRNETDGGNIFLLPKTIDYYQFQITELLERERFGEAKELLRFLLECQMNDTSVMEEWRTLLAWLEQQFPEHEEPEEEETESDMLRKALLSRAEADERFVDHLLELVQYSPGVDEKLMAIEQLTYLDHPLINDTLIRWLENADVPPTLQYTVLQALKKRGVVGEVAILSDGAPLYVRVEDTPTGIEAFPEKLQKVLTRVRMVSESELPSLVYFAEPFWLEWLYSIYATERYEYLLKEHFNPDVWAAALHFLVADRMLGGANRDAVLEMYGLAEEDDLKQFEKAVLSMDSWSRSDD
jgi:hypothetical protein